ncbi:MAG: transposase [Candidatus Omnitrophota bacterium]
MARLARLVVPKYPHHIIQRGNRRQQVFFSDQDKIAYLDYLRIRAKPAGIRFWAYCLMDNHVHLIAVPEQEDSLAYGLGEAHRRYTRMINFREEWRGYLWEGRFKSFVLDEFHLYAAMRYVERNPVRAGIVRNAWDYKWSSARAHAGKEKDPLLDNNFVIEDIKDWKSFLSHGDESSIMSLMKSHANTGRPLGDDTFIKKLEKLTGKHLKKQKPGPKKEEGGNN